MGDKRRKNRKVETFRSNHIPCPHPYSIKIKPWENHLYFSGISSEEHTVNSKHQSQNKPEDTANENIKYETDEDTKKEIE